MATAARTTVPPATLRTRTHVTRNYGPGRVVRVRTSRPWNRVEFFEWLDGEIARSDHVKHVGQLADLAGMSHTTLSNWRRGVQRPTTASLSMLAPILGVTPRELWVRAGILDATDVGMAGVDDEAGGPVDWYEEMVERSRLPRTTKDVLVAARRADVEAERKRADQHIKVMESLQSE